jgi:rSAM/selenodomain-associated transferase 1
MRTTNPDTRLLLFTKAPRPGMVKTRLVPLLGETGAAALHARLTEHALATARVAAIGSVELHCAPDCDDPFLCQCADGYGALLVPQAQGDLGARMGIAFQQALARSRYVILIGTDCPGLTANHLRAARIALATGADAVFIPTEDGGYALVGLAGHDGRVFAEIAWGENGVMNQTRERLSELGWRWRELETLWDIDRPEDYERLLELRLLDRVPAPYLDSPAETGS